MLLFQPILPAPAPLVFLTTLRQAQRLSSEVLVADARKLQGLRPTPIGFSVDDAPAGAYLNLRPYAPPFRVKAAGGYVVRAGQGQPDVLLIRRRGVWDLPKGKRDKGETMAACAAREVREELGITDVHVVQPLGQTQHGYLEKGRFAVKKTRWFLMTTTATAFSPQAEEDIDDVAWVPWAEAGQRLHFETLQAHHALVGAIVTAVFQQ